MESRHLRVCYFGTYRASYSRNQIMIEGLRRNGVEVVECHQRLWHGIEDRVHAASGGWWRPAFAVRLVHTYWRLLRALREIGDYDVMVLGYPGQLDAFLAWLITWLRRKPLVLDVFMSVYLIASERGLTAQHPFTARLIRWLEKLACRLPDLLILDTAAYVQWFQKFYDLDPNRFRLVPTGADDQIFYPLDIDGCADQRFRVLYYGTFIPNHGVEHIVGAARILRHEPDIHFELVGEGPMRSQAEALASELGLTNVTFVGWLEKQALLHKAAAADVCLGVFGTTPQSMMTVQNKIYEGLAMAKCVITGEAPTVSQTLAHGEHVWFCARASPDSLAQSILTLRDDVGLRSKLSHCGHDLFLKQFTVAALGRQFSLHLQNLLNRRDG